MRDSNFKFLRDFALSYWKHQSFFGPADVDIIGAGLVGPTAALYLKQLQPAWRMMVLERSALPGGVSKKHAGFACFDSISELMEQEKRGYLPAVVAARWAGLIRLRGLVGDDPLGHQLVSGYELFRHEEAALAKEYHDKIGYFNALLARVVDQQRTFRNTSAGGGYRLTKPPRNLSPDSGNRLISVQPNADFISGFLPMRSLARPHVSNCRLLAVLAVFAGLASGCQSSRPSFSFQPIMLRANTPMLHPSAHAAPALASTTPEAEPMQPNATEEVAVIPSAKPATKPIVVTAEQLPSHSIQLQTQVSGTTSATVASGVSTSGQQAGLQRRQLLRRAHAPAAQGLGLTVLGILGMVVLVVALVGLAISGGGVGWVLTATIAAGMVLLAYLNPGGH